jgi:tRNA nucleotidyltransferase (CCA-adding enzyme)
MNPTSKSFSELENQILSQIRPTAEEKAALKTVQQEIIADILKFAKELKQHDIVPIPVGSAERETWLCGNHDIDVFISYPQDTSFEEFKKKSHSILMKMAKTGDSWEDRHSEHPYIHIKKKGFDIDIVPCFRVKSGADIKSAVDRTPFHCAYIQEKVNGLQDDVLLLKQFMKGIGVYGSEVKTGGFSGYLTEILVIYYNGFENVLKNAAAWKAGETIDLEKHQSIGHEHPLVVADPTDPKRNVAAALSLTKFSLFVDRARAYLKAPSQDFFVKKEYPPLSKTDFSHLMKKRGTRLIGIAFETPKKADDTLYPQLFRLEKSLEELFQKNEFVVMNTCSWAEEESIILVELLADELPPIQKRYGPPVWNIENADAFCQKYQNNPDVYSFSIENERYVAEIPRKYQTGKQLIEETIIKEAALGKHVRESIKNGYRILLQKEIESIKNVSFWKFMNEKLTAQIEP